MAAADPPNFSFLPDMIWVQIMSNLSLTDKSNVSQTCHLLHEAFNHPSLWSTMKIELYDDSEKYQEWQLQPEDYKIMIEKYGHCIQNLHLVYVSKQSNIAKPCLETLMLLSQKCRLHTLILEAYVHRNRHFGLSKIQLDLQPLLSYLQNSKYLKTFIVRDWPIYPRIAAPDLMEVLKNNDKLHTLERLSLYSQDSDETTWANTFTIVPERSLVLETVGVLRNLKSLHLRSCMLCDAMLLELAKPGRVPLEFLSVLIIYSTSINLYKVPQISNEAWQKLNFRCPDLNVTFTVMNRVPCEVLQWFLKPAAPVHAVNFMRYAKCTAEIVKTVTDRYHKTLQKFTNYADGEGLDGAYINLGHRCKNLIHFTCYSTICMNTVLSLAEINEDNWKTLCFLRDSIDTLMAPDAELDDEEVVARDCSGGYYIVRPQTQAIEERESKLKFLAEQVSIYLKCKWSPISEMKTFDDSSEPEYHTFSGSTRYVGQYGRYMQNQ